MLHDSDWFLTLAWPQMACPDLECMERNCRVAWHVDVDLNCRRAESCFQGVGLHVRGVVRARCFVQLLIALRAIAFVAAVVLVQSQIRAS